MIKESFRLHSIAGTSLADQVIRSELLALDRENMMPVLSAVGQAFPAAMRLKGLDHPSTRLAKLFRKK